MDTPKPRLYLETSIVSYRTARPSRDVVTAAHQKITLSWWENQKSRFDVYVSDLVYQEAERGDAQAAQKRVLLLESFEALENVEETRDSAIRYAKEIPLPQKAGADALHLAIAAWYGMDYLPTWNCRHIANGMVRRRVEEINRRSGLPSPTICTPEELLYEIENLE